MRKAEARSLIATVLKMLRRARENYESLEWIAITIKYKDGRVTVHSKDAPARPRGLT